MTPEKNIEGKSPETSYIKITMNRASLEAAEHVYAILQGENGGVVSHVPRKDIVVDEQKVDETFTGRLNTKLLQRCRGYDLVEVEIDPGKTRQFKVDSKTHKIIPIEFTPVFYRRN